MQTKTASAKPTPDREGLILEHLPQVRAIARQIHSRLPGSVSVDDLISTGIVGLITAIDNFDPRFNVNLKTYSRHRIRGAILDSLRELDWVPRQSRKRVKMIEAAIARLEQRNHRAPTEDEIARELELSTEQYRDWLFHVQGDKLLSLDETASEEEGPRLLRVVSGSEDLWPSRIAELAELGRILAQTIEKIPYVERTVLRLYYHEQLTLREIAKVVRLHESRVSQLKSQSILRLRTSLENSGVWNVECKERPVALTGAQTKIGASGGFERALPRLRNIAATKDRIPERFGDAEKHRARPEAAA